MKEEIENKLISLFIVIAFIGINIFWYMAIMDGTPLISALLFIGLVFFNFGIVGMIWALIIAPKFEITNLERWLDK